MSGYYEYKKSIERGDKAHMKHVSMCLALQVCKIEELIAEKEKQAFHYRELILELDSRVLK